MKTVSHFAIASAKQTEYIEQLAIDLNLDRGLRNAYISDHVGRKVMYLDELSGVEAHEVINYFLEMKYGDDNDD